MTNILINQVNVTNIEYNNFSSRFGGSFPQIGAQIGQDLRHGVEVVPLEERRHRQEGDEAALIGRNHGR